VSIRVLSWNLQGRARPDLDDVAAAIRERSPDVVALQEVQRSQAAGIAARLGWWSTWRFKHWSVVVPPEGLALLAPAPLAEVRRAHLAGTARLWSWRRRIALAGTLEGPAGRCTVVDVHLGAGVGDDERARQARRTAELVAGPGCVVGDLNTKPGSVVLDAFAAVGLRDAWAEARPGERGATNWGPGPRDGAPTKRLDYALVTSDLEVRSVDVPTHGEPDFARWGALSDHLPLVVELAPRTP